MTAEEKAFICRLLSDAMLCMGEDDDEGALECADCAVYELQKIDQAKDKESR